MADDGFDNDCRWPRWLLHVDSLTSYKWQPGNVYSGIAEPQYNAISYTWGRFQLLDTEEIDVKTTPIKGISWINYLPRIRPGHFTVDELLNTIRTAACPYPEYDAVDFLWLDIACIDQTPESPTNRMEVGRQTKIFRGAKDTFIWLPSHRSNDIGLWVLKLECVIAARLPIFAGDNRVVALNSAWFASALETLRWFIKDPWFSSLWTLQEAFLSPKAIFIWRDGLSEEFVHLCRNDKGAVKLFTLKMWVSNWQTVRIRRKRELQMFPEARELNEAIDTTGVLGGVYDEWMNNNLFDIEIPSDLMGNPFQLLAAAKHRTATHREDHVYAIMQVFDLRLGHSDPSASDRHFTLDELEIQLASALLQRYPIFSQLVTHPTTPRSHPTWMITSDVSLPDEAIFAWTHEALGGEVIALTSFSVVAGAKNIAARFRGPMASLATFWGVVAPIKLHDVVLLLDENPEGLPDTHDREPTRFEPHHLSNLQILLLGRLTPPDNVVLMTHQKIEKYQNWTVGLLLQSCSTKEQGT
ncbi:hypothetical protein H2200_000623 [Cladophialophora chaetospira]|uniref:Heterokaryon incompatibility domain-containing protein n=1 Tax=Cladophialophora chaetospira TaxID=386627 RepID=A0AA38XNR7_9EURO|nr:hypothetical protein H2200_000623 [Cladophialophora chaetospira]